MGLILTRKKGSALHRTRHLPTFIALQIWGTMNKWGCMHIAKEQQQWTTIKKKSKRDVTVVLNRADTEQTLHTMWRVIQYPALSECHCDGYLTFIGSSSLAWSSCCKVLCIYLGKKKIVRDAPSSLPFLMWVWICLSGTHGSFTTDFSPS